MVRPDGIACASVSSVTISPRGTWAEQQARSPRSARPADEAMARRPFSALGVRLTPPPGTPVGGASSLVDIARGGRLAFLYCDRCDPPYRIGGIDFREWPWTRYLNYPGGSRFVCTGCGHPLIMHVHPRRAFTAPAASQTPPFSASEEPTS